MVASQQDLRLVRPVQDPFPWYIRAGYNDHRMLEDKLAAGESRISRVVLDAAHLERHGGLIAALQSKRAELILDPRFGELSTPAGSRKTLQRLDWFQNAAMPRPEDFDARRIESIAVAIARRAALFGFSAVLAPTHAIDDEGRKWLDVDLDMCHALRKGLDENGGSRIRINYPLMIPYQWLMTEKTMLALSGAMSTVPIDSIWLRVSNFHNDKSAAAVRNYIEGAQPLLRANRTLVADHITGVSGLAIVAFGAAGGLVHGIGTKESFRSSDWFKPPAAFGIKARVFIPDADLYIQKETLEPLLKDPALRTKFGCTRKYCCPRGVHDMMTNPKVHLMNSRFDQLAEIQASPESRRAPDFVRRVMRPMGTQLMKLDHALAGHSTLQKKVQRKRRFVDDLTIALEDLAREMAGTSTRSLIPRKLPFRPTAVANNNNTRPSI